MYYLPSPADIPPVEGTDLEHADKKLFADPRKTSPSAVWSSKSSLSVPATCTSFASIRTLKANSRVLNPGKDKKENIAQLYQVQADRRAGAKCGGRRHCWNHRAAQLA